ncbi:MAG: hypothetical protein FJ095_18500 [Deltaproteobacteria bacterium]|nr:hypothetical protein [Deltaproteobacteria bacterium]
MRRALCLVLLVMGCATTGGPASTSAPPPSPTPIRARVTIEPTAPPPAPTRDGAGDAELTWGRCGELECLRFASSLDALLAVIASTRPRVLALGEAHAPRGAEGIASTAKRFEREWLSALRGRVSDVVMEIALPPKGCDATKRDVKREVERPVVANQRGDNQSEFLGLASACRAAGIEPWPLEPSCDELAAVTAAGEDGVGAMLSLVAELTARRVTLLERRRGPDALIVAYGGALHNDVAPLADRERWSFGARFAASLGPRYVELDAFVPEFVKDTESWRRMPWYRHYDPSVEPEQATLYRLGPASFTLIFPRTTAP